MVGMHAEVTSTFKRLSRGGDHRPVDTQRPVASSYVQEVVGSSRFLGRELAANLGKTLEVAGSVVTGDVESFALLGNQPFVVAVHPLVPAKSIAELIALAKQKPGEITYGSSGLGAAGHVNVALLESMANIKLTPVHYRGATPALNDVLAGHIMLTYHQDECWYRNLKIREVK